MNKLYCIGKRGDRPEHEGRTMRRAELSKPFLLEKRRWTKATRLIRAEKIAHLPYGLLL
jgi:hypothetical protein